MTAVYDRHSYDPEKRADATSRTLDSQARQHVEKGGGAESPTRPHSKSLTRG